MKKFPIGDHRQTQNLSPGMRKQLPRNFQQLFANSGRNCSQASSLSLWNIFHEYHQNIIYQRDVEYYLETRDGVFVIRNSKYRGDWQGGHLRAPKYLDNKKASNQNGGRKYNNLFQNVLNKLRKQAGKSSQYTSNIGYNTNHNYNNVYQQNYIENNFQQQTSSEYGNEYKSGSQMMNNRNIQDKRNEESKSPLRRAKSNSNIKNNIINKPSVKNTNACPNSNLIAFVTQTNPETNIQSKTGKGFNSSGGSNNGYKINIVNSNPAQLSQHSHLDLPNVEHIKSQYGSNLKDLNFSNKTNVLLNKGNCSDHGLSDHSSNAVRNTHGNPPIVNAVFANSNDQPNSKSTSKGHNFTAFNIIHKKGKLGTNNLMMDQKIVQSQTIQAQKHNIAQLSFQNAQHFTQHHQQIQSECMEPRNNSILADYPQNVHMHGNHNNSRDIKQKEKDRVGNLSSVEAGMLCSTDQLNHNSKQAKQKKSQGDKKSIIQSLISHNSKQKDQKKQLNPIKSIQFRTNEANKMLEKPKSLIRSNPIDAPKSDNIQIDNSARYQINVLAANGLNNGSKIKKQPQKLPQNQQQKYFGLQNPYVYSQNPKNYVKVQNQQGNAHSNINKEKENEKEKEKNKEKEKEKEKEKHKKLTDQQVCQIISSRKRTIGINNNNKQVNQERELLNLSDLDIDALLKISDGSIFNKSKDKIQGDFIRVSDKKGLDISDKNKSIVCHKKLDILKLEQGQNILARPNEEEKPPSKITRIVIHTAQNRLNDPNSSYLNQQNNQSSSKFPNQSINNINSQQLKSKTAPQNPPLPKTSNIIVARNPSSLAPPAPATNQCKNSIPYSTPVNPSPSIEPSPVNNTAGTLVNSFVPHYALHPSSPRINNSGTCYNFSRNSQSNQNGFILSSNANVTKIAQSKVFSVRKSQENNNMGSVVFQLSANSNF